MKQGTLYVVATPIGHLEDLSVRAISILKTVDVIAAEDTRKTQVLLQQLGLKKPLLSLHDHNERERLAPLLERLQQGASIALVSDAGTPLVSDPGYLLVSGAHEQHSAVIPIPGACAAIAALSVAGIACNQFKFIGFLPRTAGARRELLEQLALEHATLIFYESPHRLQQTVIDLNAIFGGDRLCTLGRELTKLHEQVWRTTLHELACGIEDQRVPLLGEIVLVIAGNTQADQDPKQGQALEILELLQAELPFKQAVHLTAKITKVNKNWLYEQGLKKPRVLL